MNIWRIQHLAFRPGFTKSASDHHGIADFLASALYQDVGHDRCVERDHRDIAGTVDIGDGWQALLIADAFVFRIDRVDAAAITVPLQRGCGFTARRVMSVLAPTTAMPRGLNMRKKAASLTTCRQERLRRRAA